MEEEQPDRLQLPSYRRLLPPGHELFYEGDLEREEIVYWQSIQGNPSDEAQPIDQIFAEPADAFLCSSCKASMPSGHLLDLHTAETHDSFFAAQAARRMKVFRCLVEGCSKAFTSIMERRQHLRDVHAFPTNYAFDRLHLVKKQAQLRPETSHQKSSGRAFKAGRDNAGPGRSSDLASRGLVQGLIPDEAKRGEPPGAPLQSSVQLGLESGAMEGFEGRSLKAEASRGARGRSRGAASGSRAEDMDIDGLSEKFSSLGARNLLSQPRRGRGHRVVL